MNENHKFIKENGIFYTDKKLAKKMINLMKIDYKSDFNLIEPAVGEGHILYLIVEKYFVENINETREKQAKFLKNNIAGFDIRREAIEVCKNKLNKLAMKYIKKKIDWNIREFNALDRDKLVEIFGTYDYVISNPPYVSRHNMDGKTIDILKNNSYFCSKFNFDLYYYFFELSFDLWNNKGKIVYITPNSYIKARSGEVMMKYLIENSLIEVIIDYEDEMKFEGANTYTAISVFSKSNLAVIVKNAKGKTMLKVSYEDLVDKFNYRIYSHEFLFIENDSFFNLEEIAEIKNGLATLQDKVFVINEKEILDKKNNFLYIKKE
ncbi:hypothetical protein DCT10_13035, partial [Listeria monocytogenes]|nr:hypothetical protein [Listeria monocytogenes]